MLFAAKTKGYFVAQNEHTFLFARTAAAGASLLIESVGECAAGDVAAVEQRVRELPPKRSPSGYLHAAVSVYPPRRMVRRATLEAKRLKEPGYLEEVCATQFRVEPKDYMLGVLSAADGTAYDPAKAVGREVVFGGMHQEDIGAAQDALLAQGIYPERLELGTIAELGAVADYLAFTKSRVPTLVLELGEETTHSFIVTAGGLETARPIASGLAAMVPVVQKELGLKDEEAARKLFLSNTFDFTGMGPALIKKLLKELQSSIGFYEVQTGQSVGQLLCTQLPPALGWLQETIASLLGVAVLKLDFAPWLQSRQITLAEPVKAATDDPRWLALFALIARYDTAHAAETEAKA